MERSDLLTYLKSQRYGVLGSVSSSQQPQGAFIGYAVTPQLEILFDTIRSSRKYTNLLTHPRVSFTVGGADERTVQFEGMAEELSGLSLQQLRPLYYEAWPDGPAREGWVGITWFVLRPLWVRFSDYNVPQMREWTF